MELASLAKTLFARANQVPGMRGVLEFRFSADQVISVTVADTVTVGAPKSSPDVTITLSADDFMAVATGDRDIARLFTAGKIQVAGDFGLATLLPQAIQVSMDSATNATPNNAPVNPQAQSGSFNAEEQRYPAPTRHAEVVTASQPPLHHVERFEQGALSPATFRREYVLRCRPVIIGNALRSWPLYNMSQEDSIRHFEGLQGMVRTGDYVTRTFSRNRQFKTESMADFIRSSRDYSAAGQADPPPYLGSNSIPERLETLIDWPEFFRRDQYIPPRIWIGPQGTVTPLHRDDTDNLFAQVWGEKTFILAAPHERSRLYTWTTYRHGGLEGCEVDAEAPDYQKHPAARDARFLKVHVGPGDMLFIPDGWFHHVRSLSMSLSVNFWTRSARKPGEAA